MKFMLPLLFLSSCNFPLGPKEGVDFFTVNELSPRKQKQKISSLQKKLETAEEECAKSTAEVEHLRREMDLAQLSLIRRLMDDFEKEVRKEGSIAAPLRKRGAHNFSTLFIPERDLLQKMIQSGPSPSSFEAQVVLDQFQEMLSKLESI